jgi:exopolysaccharide biosynthesis polyprenyl glycosylphosphotransferase
MLQLYTTNALARRGRASLRVCMAALATGAVAFAVVPDAQRGALVVGAAGAVLAAAFVNVGRVCFEQWLTSCRARGLYLRPIIVVGTREESEAFLELLDDNPEYGYRVCAVVGPDPHAGNDRVPWLGPTSSAQTTVAEMEATGAILLVNGIPSTEVRSIVRDLVAGGTHVHLSNGMLGLGCRRLEPVPVGHEPLMYVRPASLSRLELAGKRAIDIVVAGLALLISAPVILIAAAAIKLQDGGPVFFRQIRVGQGGRRIVVHKLRTMVVDAELLLDEVRHLNERQGPLFKMERDPRVTRVGGLLRSSSIDELPQLFDVLLGRMSVVGPRPALPAEVANFDDELKVRQLVRPGVTGLWQIEGRDKPGFESYSRLDRFYVENWSLGLDLSILVRTVPVVASRGLTLLRPRVRRALDRNDDVTVDLRAPVLTLSSDEPRRILPQSIATQ